MRSVKEETLELLTLRDSVRDLGILTPILVTPSDGGRYEVIHGFRRLEVAKQLNLTEIPVFVKENLSLDDIKLIQVVANASREEVSADEYCKRLISMMSSGKSLFEVAREIGKHPDWVKRKIGILSVLPEVFLAYQEKAITIEVLRLISKFPQKKQRELLGLDLDKIRAALRHKRELKGAGQLKPRHTVTLRNEFYNRQAAGLELIKHKCKTPSDGWNCAFNWIFNVDESDED
jgi:ParB family chromosome partitioning protein